MQWFCQLRQIANLSTSWVFIMMSVGFVRKGRCDDHKGSIFDLTCWFLIVVKSRKRGEFAQHHITVGSIPSLKDALFFESVQMDHFYERLILLPVLVGHFKGLCFKHRSEVMPWGKFKTVLPLYYGCCWFLFSDFELSFFPFWLL